MAVLPEYRNLTESELVMADHYAEIGDFNALARFQRLSAEREGKDASGINEVTAAACHIKPTQQHNS